MPPPAAERNATEMATKNASTITTTTADDDTDGDSTTLTNPPSETDVLRLNVGGTCMDVLRRTLTSVEDSLLAVQFSG